MLCAVGLDAAACGYEVLQAWLCENADAGRETVLQAEAERGGELPWGMEGGFFARFMVAIYEVVGVQGRIDRYFRRQPCTAVEVPPRPMMDVENAFHWNADIVNDLSLVDGAAVGAHLEIGEQTAVVEACFNAPTVIQLVFQSQRPCHRHTMVAGAHHLVLSRAFGVA